MFSLVFPSFDPVALQIGPLAIRWYALAYVAGLLLGWRYCIYWAKKSPHILTRMQLDDFLSWAIIGIILGGRLGYVLFYNSAFYTAHPEAILQIWKGGMSFHGGLLGIILAMYLFSKKHNIPFWGLADLVAAAGPIGLFLGRIANFVNSELWGRTTDLPWGIVFPNAGPLARHPSQLYEAVLEGLILFTVSFFFIRKDIIRARLGTISGIFLAGYAISRIIVEFFREPDEQIGFLWGFVTMGQILSLPMLFFGLYLIYRKIGQKA